MAMKGHAARLGCCYDGAMTDLQSFTADARDARRAMLLGLKSRCPSCGEARLFARYLKPVDACPACGQDWTHQRADDLPAYRSEEHPSELQSLMRISYAVFCLK